MKGVSRIIASDVDARRRTHLEQEFKNYNFQLRIVEDKRELSILFEDVDCVAPCAVGGILSPETISRIKARVVCGAANNQLLHLNRDDKLLAKHGILYMPDFLVNRMGIVNCADEHMGALGEDDPKLALHLGKIWDNSIYNLTMTILRQSVNSNRTPQEIAVEMAEARSHEINPVYGHRAWQVIKLIATRGEWMDRVKMH